MRRCGRSMTPLVRKGRTALTYTAWREDELTQIAVAWILGCVFVRFLEDNGLRDAATCRVGRCRAPCARAISRSSFSAKSPASPSG